jgi:hypothetical protein
LAERIDFVEKKCTTLSGSHQSIGVTLGTGERPGLMAEHLVLE